MVAKGFVLYTIQPAINKICPNDIFKIIFDNEKTFKIASVSFYKKENSNTSAYKLSLM